MKTTIPFIAMCLIITGCTERHPVSPLVTDDVSWIPNMSIIGNGYQRVEMLLDEVPSDQIIRNLKALTIEAQKLGETQYTVTDSLFVLRFVLSGYTSSPVLEEGADYLVRFSAEYRSGVVKKGNAVSIHSPEIKGKVLKQIDHPQPVSGVSFGGPSDFAFWQGKMFVLYWTTLIQIDTSTGNWTVVSNSIVDDSHDRLQMTFVNDTLVIVSHNIAGDGPMTISWINATNMVLIKEADIYPGERPFISDLSNDGSELLMFVQHSASIALRFLRADIETGSIISEVPAPSGMHQIAVSNGNLWLANSYSYDNRIRRVDPITFSVAEEHQNPVFIMYELAWDGTHFWAFDYEMQTYSKLQLEGL